MITLAFVTCAELPELTADDRLGADTLRDAGARVRAVPWDDPRAAWDGYDAVVLRSCWDYHLRYGEFCRWVADAEARGGVLLNPPRAVLWNADKRYLRDMEARGTEIVPTEWVEPGAPGEVGSILERRGWGHAVVKPAVSASAYQTRRVTRGALPLDEDAGAAGGVALLVQPFLREVVEDGEWSLLFFGGSFSHAVLKRPCAGDFRVQADFGGRAEAAEPPSAVVDAAARALRTAEEVVGEPLAYARVDGVVSGGSFLLMELEAIEPSLFLYAHPDAPARFARAVLACR